MEGKEDLLIKLPEAVSVSVIMIFSLLTQRMTISSMTLVRKKHLLLSAAISPIISLKYQALT
jgi:hypothetical protein